jgi:TolB-like protein
MTDLWQRLGQRKLVQWAIAYLAGAWVLLQVLGLAAESYEWPTAIMRLAFILMALGFIVALVLAWYHGERGAQRVSGPELLILALLLALGGGFLWRYAQVSAPTRGEPVPHAINEAPVASSAPSTAPAQSIAVLPFNNMSASKDNEYFADGIAEELLNQLAQLPGLQVAGRTSSFAFKGHNEDLREIGRKLGVAYVLEGSVRRSLDRVRITAQLIKAADGFHVWSQTYDRELTDIFAVQDEISAAITAALELSLMGNGAAAPASTKVAVNAFDAFLKGQSLLALRGTDNLNAARTQFQAALKIDPNYAPALVSLARTDLLIPLYGQLTGDAVKQLVDEAATLAQRSLATEPDNASAHLVLGTLYSNYQWRWQEAGQEFDRARQLAPGSAEVANFSGDYYVMLLDRQRALATEQRALDLDPLAPFNRWDMAWAALSFGEYAQAIAHAEASRAMAPAAFEPFAILVWSYGQLHRFAEMHQAISDARALTHAQEPQYLLLDAWAAIAEGRRDDALAALARLEPDVTAGKASSAILGFNYLLLGESARARNWLQQAYQQRDAQLVFQEPVDLALIARDPLTRDILEQPGLKELVEIRKRNGAFKAP